MAEWPSTLPPPQKRISLTPGNTRKTRDTVSGRKEIRRMGSGAPDQIRVLFRLTWAQWAIFKRLHEWDFNLGVNWFSASWLTTLGYTAHKARFLGYPREVARQQYYVDVIATLLVQVTADIIDVDTEWPCDATGPPPVPPPMPGLLCGAEIHWTGLGRLPAIPPGTLANKAITDYDLIFYSLGGTFHVLGTPPLYLTGWDAIGGVADFVYVDNHCVVYLTDVGQVIAFGTYANAYGLDTPPAFPSAVVSLYSGYRYCAALCTNGEVVCWGTGVATYGIQDETGVSKVSAGQFNLMCIKTTGEMTVSGGDNYGIITSKPTILNAQAGCCHTYWAACVDTALIPHYWGHVTHANAMLANHPAGLNPTKMVTDPYYQPYHVCYAIHSTTELVGWGRYPQDVVPISGGTCCQDVYCRGHADGQNAVWIEP